LSAWAKQRIVGGLPISVPTKAALGVANGLLTFSASLASDQNGKKIDSTAIVAQASLLSREYQTRMLAMGDAMVALQNVVLTDADKLGRFAALARTPSEQGGFAFDDSALVRARDTLSQAARRSFYAELLPATFDLYTPDLRKGETYTDDGSPYRPGELLSSEPTELLDDFGCDPPPAFESTERSARTAISGFGFGLGISGVPEPRPRVWAMAARTPPGALGASSWKTPSAETLAGLFDAPEGSDGGGVGANPDEVFWDWGWTHRSVDALFTRSTSGGTPSTPPVDSCEERTGEADAP